MPKDEEQGIDSYYPGGFHPVHISETYNNKYQVLQKLGHGRYSTVWLVKDESTQRLWAVKVLSAECYGTDDGIFELEILQHLKKGDANHPGYNHISILEDSFTHVGSNGSHLCLIFKLMGESLHTFRDWFEERMIPTPLIQRFTSQLLQALNYAHERGVIHTDIQPSNIMVQIPDETLITASLCIPSTSQPSTPKSKEYEIISTKTLRDIYFPEGFNMMELSIALSDWGVASFTTNHLIENIQPILLRAPEVLLQAPWETGVDIWNLGALVPELVFGQRMFCGRDNQGRYSVKTHMEEMARLLGPFKAETLKRGDSVVVEDVFNEDGTLKERSLEKVVGLEERFEGMEEGERGKFVRFIRRMLVLDPEERTGARELLGDESLKHDYYEDVGGES